MGHKARGHWKKARHSVRKVQLRGESWGTLRGFRDTEPLWCRDVHSARDDTRR